MYVCEPGEVHVTRRVYVPGDYTVFFFDPEAMARAAGGVGLGAEPHFEQRGVGRPDLWQRFAALKSLLEPGCSEALEQELAELVATLLVETQTRAELPDCGEGLLDEVRLLLVERYRSDPSRVVRLATIAEEVGISYYHLVHAFSRRYGVAPYEFVALIRAQHALSELRRGPRDDCRTLTALAQQCGYSDSAHMSRSFRRYWGVPPRALARDVNPAWVARAKARRTQASTPA